MAGSQAENAVEVIREELLPLVERLCDLARAEEEPEQELFFDRIRQGLVEARDAEDMAGPFMELSTSAFLGFQFSLGITILLDAVLATAQAFSLTLSAPADEPH